LTVLGLDIGGANLKAVHSDGMARSVPFELWKQPENLAGALADLARAFPPADVLAVTMTGELCDCYPTKRHGVTAILDAVETVAAGRPIRVWRNDGRFVDLAEARVTPLDVAAANWLALATWAGRWLTSGSGLLIDVGSTTTDIIPLLDGRPVPRGRTDPQRLDTRELVYTGVRRTPVCALLGGRGAAEWFATTLDVNLVLGLIPENAMDRATADGRPATRAAARSRLARMRCADDETCTPPEIHALAESVLQSQEALLTQALDEVIRNQQGPPDFVLLAGSGEFLARRVLRRQWSVPPPAVISLAEKLGPELSEAACAHALVVLSSEHSHARR
jgi:probable H4MPT-linked C1 transfer pathway protein